MISCAANCGPLSVVIDLTGSPLSRMSLTTAFASGTACFPLGASRPQPQGKPPRCFSCFNAPQSFALLIGISTLWECDEDGEGCNHTIGHTKTFV